LEKILRKTTFTTKTPRGDTTVQGGMSWEIKGGPFRSSFWERNKKRKKRRERVRKPNLIQVGTKGGKATIQTT